MIKRWVARVAVVLIAFPVLAARPQQRRASEPSAKKASEPVAKDRSEERTQPDSVTQLANDLAAIKSGSSVTKAQKEALAGDLMAMADGATKADAALVDTLVNDLTAAFEDGAISTKDAMKLASDIDAVMDSANIPKSEVDKTIADAQAILIASGVTKSDVETIVKDLQAIAADLQGARKRRG